MTVDNKNVHTSLFLLFGIGIIFWLLFVGWYSKLSVTKSAILQPGKAMPELHFKTYTNEPFYTSSLLGKKVIYIFYRGNWCPVCRSQIKEIVGQYIDLKELGAEILMISPQPQKKSKQLAAGMKMPLLFLTDEQNEMAKKLKIEDKNGVPLAAISSGYDADTVFPTVVITDEQGKIIFLDQTENFRKRPHPSSFLSALNMKVA
jgi:peroxiredoxin